MEMDKGDFLGNLSMYGGVLTTCTATPAAVLNETTMPLIFSALGAFAAICGLAYTVWNGNRNFRLAQQQLDLHLKRTTVKEGVADGAQSI